VQRFAHFETGRTKLFESGEISKYAPVSNIRPWRNTKNVSETTVKPDWQEMPLKSCQ